MIFAVIAYRHHRYEKTPTNDRGCQHRSYILSLFLLSAAVTVSASAVDYESAALSNRSCARKTPIYAGIKANRDEFRRSSPGVQRGCRRVIPHTDGDYSARCRRSRRRDSMVPVIEGDSDRQGSCVLDRGVAHGVVLASLADSRLAKIGACNSRREDARTPRRRADSRSLARPPVAADQTRGQVGALH